MTIKRWDPSSLKVVEEIRCPSGIMSLHVCEEEICAGCRDGSIYYWVAGKLRFRQKVFSSGVISVRYIPEYRWIAAVPVSDSKMLVMQVEDGVIAQEDITQLFDGAISAMIFSKCEKYLILGGGRCLVLFDVELNQVVQKKLLDGYVVCMTLTDDNARIHVGIAGRCYYIVAIPELDVIEKVVLPTGFLIRMAYDSTENFLYLLFGEGVGVVNPPNNEFVDFYEFQEELRERIGYMNLCVHGESVYLSSTDHVRMHKRGNASESTMIEYRRSCDRGVAKADSYILLLADLRAPLVAVDEQSGEKQRSFPFFVSDLNYIAESWDEPQCLVLGTNMDGTILTNVADNSILSMVPERYDMLLRHPSKPLWAVSFLDTFRIIAVEHT